MQRIFKLDNSIMFLDPSYFAYFAQWLALVLTKTLGRLAVEFENVMMLFIIWIEFLVWYSFAVQARLLFNKWLLHGDLFAWMNSFLNSWSVPFSPEAITEQLSVPIATHFSGIFIDDTIRFVQHLNNNK